jgi:hypothetical protein
MIIARSHCLRGNVSVVTSKDNVRALPPLRKERNSEDNRHALPVSWCGK